MHHPLTSAACMAEEVQLHPRTLLAEETALRLHLRSLHELLELPAWRRSSGSSPPSSLVTMQATQEAFSGGGDGGRGRQWSALGFGRRPCRPQWSEAFFCLKTLCKSNMPQPLDWNPTARHPSSSPHPCLVSGCDTTALHVVPTSSEVAIQSEWRQNRKGPHPHLRNCVLAYASDTAAGHVTPVLASKLHAHLASSSFFRIQNRSMLFALSGNDQNGTPPQLVKTDNQEGKISESVLIIFPNFTFIFFFILSTLKSFTIYIFYFMFS